MSVAILLSLLAVLTLVFLCTLTLKLWRRPAVPNVEALIVSAIANFFDALGIGSFASTTAYFKLRRLVPDELIPATMMVGYATATVTEAFVYITVIRVDTLLLYESITASSLGALLGVFVAPRLPVRVIRTTMGIGLIIAAMSYALSNLGLIPQGGSATDLAPRSFAIAVVISGLLGLLMNLGIGTFAPTLIMFGLLGFDPRTAFPIMMGSCAFLMITSGIQLIRDRPLDLSMIIALAIGGVPGVLVAAYLVKTLPLAFLRWGVVAVVSYAGLVMLRAALGGSNAASANLRRV